MRPILDGPVHTTTNATQRESSLGWRCRWQVARMQLSYDPLIETAVRTVRTDVVAKLQLPTLQRDGRINACLVQSLQVTLTLIGIHDVNRLVAALEPLFL